MKIGFTCGAFDLCHAGHILMFKECREQCDKLIIGLQNDPSVDRADKNKPIQSYEERLIQIEAIKYIDEVFAYNTEIDLYKYLMETPPDIRFIGEDWRGKPFTGHDLPVTIVFNTRTHNYSSSELRERIFTAEFEKYFSNPWKDDLIV